MPIKDFPSYIQKTEAIKLIAERTKPHYEDLRSWKNKINGQLKTRIKNGLIRQQNGLLNSADIVKSMRKLYPDELYPDAFADFPRNFLLENASFSVDVNPTGASFSMMKFPNTLDDCHRIIEAQHKENLCLKMELARLKPDAEGYRKIVERNRINGKLNRGKQEQ